MNVDKPRRGSYIAHLDDKTALVRRPIASRIIFGCVAVLMALMIAALVFGVLAASAEHKQATGRSDSELLPLLGVGLPLAVVTALFLNMSGPADISFDWQAHAYQYRYGFPICARVKTGSLAEFDYVFGKIHIIGNFAGTASAQYLVCLDWKRRAKILGVFPAGDLILYSSADSDESDAMAKTFGGLMGIPVESERRGTPSFWRKYFFDF